MRSLVPILFTGMSVFLTQAATVAAQEVDRALMRETLLGEFETSFADCLVPADRVPNTLAAYAWRIGRGFFSGFESMEEDVATDIAEAFWAESLASGALIEDEAGVRLPECPDSPQQQALRVERASDALLDMEDEDAMVLFTEIMGIHGCRVPISLQDRFIETGLRHVAALHGVELPDPMPSEADPDLTRLVEIIYNVLDDAGEDLIRSGALVVENEVATLSPCTPTGPALRVEPEAAMAEIAAIGDSDMAMLVAEAFQTAGCTVPDSQVEGLHLHFVRTVLASVGVPLSVENMRQYGMTQDGPAADYARVIAYLQPRFETLVGQMSEPGLMNGPGMIVREEEDWALFRCRPVTEVTDLDAYYP